MIKKIIMNKELRLVAVSQIIQMLGATILVKLLAVLLSKQDYGYYSLALTIFTLVSILPFTAFDQGISRYVSIYKKDGIFQKYYINIIVIYLSIFFIYFLGWNIFKIFMSINTTWLSVSNTLIIYIITEVLKNTLISIEIANRERKIVALLRILEYSLKIIIVFLLSKLKKICVEDIFIIYLSVNLAIIVGLLLKNKNNIKISSINLKNIKLLFIDIWFFSYPLVIWAIFGWFQNTATKWLLNGFLNAEIVAEFSLLTSIAFLPANGVQGIVNGFIIPIIYEKENVKIGYARNTLKKLIPIVGIIYIFMVTFTAIFKNLIIIIVADSKYLDNSWMLPIMLFGTCLYTLSMMSASEMLAHKKTKNLIVPNIIPGIFAIIGGYFLIKQFDLMGAIITFLVTYLLYASIMAIIVIRYSKNNI